MEGSLYELLAGHRLFEGANAPQVLEALLQKEAPPLHVRLDDPRAPAVERVVRRMLEKNPLNRFDDLQAVGLALAAAQRGDILQGSRAGTAFPNTLAHRGAPPGALRPARRRRGEICTPRAVVGVATGPRATHASTKR